MVKFYILSLSNTKYSNLNRLQKIIFTTKKTALCCRRAALNNNLYRNTYDPLSFLTTSSAMFVGTKS